MWAIAFLIMLPSKVYFTFQKIMFIIAMAGIIVTVLLLLGTTREGFISSFNSAIAPYTNATYQSIISAANQAGWNTNPPPSMVNTLGIVPIAFLTLGYGWYTAYFSGEVKEVAKSQMWGIVGSLLFCGIFLALVGWLYESVIGYQFLSALAYIFYVGGTKVTLPFAPYYTTIVSFLTKNPLLISLIAITLAAWGWQWICGNVWAASRSLFAWSYDRLGPEYLSRVHSKWHTPYAAIITVYLVAQIIMVAYVFTPYLAMLGGMFGTCITFAFVALAALLLPFRRKDIFEKMPLRHRIAGIPVMSIAGAIGLLLNFIMFYYAFTVPELGMVTVPMEFTLVVIFALGFVIYYLIKAYRKKQGVDLELAYKEVPPA
jgi:amino acid transporter